MAVSANIVPLALGTETDTSIIGPASSNGIVGIKPTVGLTSRDGVIPISVNMDSVGTFGRTVRDAVRGLTAIAGIDPRDEVTKSILEPHKGDYAECLTNQSSLVGAIFGLPGNKCWDCVAADLKKVAFGVFEHIEAAGGQILRTDFPCAKEHLPPDGRWDW